MKPTVTIDRLKECLNYSPITGVFTWRHTVGGNCKKGFPAGRAGTGKAAGYWRINVDGREYKYHRLAWFYMTGEWPKDQIDHINGDPSDNRFSNLREATPTQNKANSGAYKNSKSGFKGVSLDGRKRKWISVIQINKKQTYLGQFDEIEDAILAYKKAAETHFGSFSRTS